MRARRPPTEIVERLEFPEAVGNELTLRRALGALLDRVLVRPEGSELKSRLKEGLRQVRASAGAGGVYSIVEVAPWSRIPEQRALLVPRDE